MAGIGERLGSALTLPPLFALLVNPGVPVETAPVFRALGLQPGQRHPLHSSLPDTSPHPEEPRSGVSKDVPVRSGASFETMRAEGSRPTSEYRAVADDRQGRAAAGASLGRDAPACRPGAAFQNLGERQFLRRAAEPLADERADLVQQRHRKRPPFDDQRRACLMGAPRLARILERDDAPIEQEPAIAVLRQAGQFVDVDDGDAGPLQRLDQRIGQPLRELVEGHEPGRGGALRDQRVAPGVAQRDARQRQARGPDAAEGGQNLAEHVARAQAPGLGRSQEAVEQIAG
eukprot:gene19246-27267_t